MTERDRLLSALVQGDRQAAKTLEARTELLTGLPPPSLIDALRALDRDPESGLFKVARAWERAPLGHALLAAFQHSSDSNERERLAWLLKNFAAPGDTDALVELASDETQPLQLRIYFVQGLDWLSFNHHSVTWAQVEELILRVGRSPEAVLRRAMIGLVATLPASPERDDELRQHLDDTDTSVVLTAINELQQEGISVDADTRARLLRHANVGIRTEAARLRG